MQSIQSIKSEYQKVFQKKGLNYPQIKKEILNDSEVKAFIKKYEDVITDEMIDRNLNELYWVIRFRKEEEYRFYSLKLAISNGCIVHRYFHRPEVLPLLNKPANKRKLNVDMLSLDNQAATLYQYDNSAGRKAVINEVKKILDTYQDGEFSTGLWVVGNNGIGKTYLMAGLAKELNKRLSSVTMVEMNELITDLKSEISKNSNQLNQRITHLQDVDVLIMDDIGTERLTDWVADEILYPILNSRYKAQKTTFFTSNLTKLDYANRLKGMDSKQDRGSVHQRAKRIMTRIDGLVKEVQTSGTNRRKLNH